MIVVNEIRGVAGGRVGQLYNFRTTALLRALKIMELFLGRNYLIIRLLRVNAQI